MLMFFNETALSYPAQTRLSRNLCQKNSLSLNKNLRALSKLLGYRCVQKFSMESIYTVPALQETGTFNAIET